MEEEEEYERGIVLVLAEKMEHMDHGWLACRQGVESLQEKPLTMSVIGGEWKFRIEEEERTRIEKGLRRVIEWMYHVADKVARGATRGLGGSGGGVVTLDPTDRSALNSYLDLLDLYLASLPLSHSLTPNLVILPPKSSFCIFNMANRPQLMISRHYACLC